jgi:recyclin-1
MELGPTRGCTAAIACLETHCQLVRGSTNREVLEVFYQEIGIRLIGYDLMFLILALNERFKTTSFFFSRILQKHIKRQIISLSGGFQVIADLNAYYAFIASLKVCALIPFIRFFFSAFFLLIHSIGAKPDNRFFEP